MLLEDQARYKETEENYLKSLELSPNEITVLNNYSDFLYLRGRIEESEEINLKILRLDPNDSMAYHDLARI